MKEMIFFDLNFPEQEQLPRTFTINFKTIEREGKTMTKITYKNKQVGDLIDDNSRLLDNYRFHDVFHYTFATVLGWSPCSRAMMKRKRKSISDFDQFEDGARATITEEAISLMVFNYARKRNLLDSDNNVESEILDFIKDFTSPFEVSKCTKEEWEKAILLGYTLFRNLVKHNGGNIRFDMISKTAHFVK